MKKVITSIKQEERNLHSLHIGSACFYQEKSQKYIPQNPGFVMLIVDPDTCFNEQNETVKLTIIVQKNDAFSDPGKVKKH